jgi:hypothetical protein
MQHGLHVSERRKLTALTSLHVQYAESGMERFRESLQGLAAITQIVELDIAMKSPDLPVAALLPSQASHR